MITIEIPFIKDVMFLTTEFGNDFKSDVGFIKNSLLGRKWNNAYKRWEVPTLNINKKTMRSFASKFENLEIIDELDAYDTAPYIIVDNYGGDYTLDFVYDTSIISMIKSIMHYPKDKGYNAESKNWSVSPDTWRQLRISLATYINEIGERVEFPKGEDIEFLVAKGKSSKHNSSISDEDYEDLCLTIKGEYPFLRDYQARDVAKYTTTIGILNANQMGLGKTIETGAYIDLQNPPSVLIVVPASLKIQWQKELVRFFPKLEKIIFVIKGTIKQREKIWRKALGRKQHIIITNYANLRTKDYIEFKLNEREFDMLVFDEITKCKNRKTETFKMAERLNGIMKVGLTGTPIENHISDIFNIMKLIHPFFFGSWSEFSRKYFYKGGYQGKEYFEKPEAPRKIADELKEFFGWIRWNRKTVLKELPELLINTYRVQLNPKERKAYELLRKQLLEIYDKEGYQVNLKNILSLILAMRRLCSDPQIYDLNFQNSAKKSEFVRIVKDNLNGQKILVFSQFKDCVKLYSKALERVGIKTMVITGDTKQKDRPMLIEHFKNSKDIKVLMCTDAFSYGQNLQMCSIMINIDQHFNPAIIKQRIGRIQRIGQKEKVLNVINFLVEDSIEEFIYEKIMRKNILFDTIITQNEEKFSFTQVIQEYLKEGDKSDEIEA